VAGFEANFVGFFGIGKCCWVIGRRNLNFCGRLETGLGRGTGVGLGGC
jgi:hypothetical protein